MKSEIELWPPVNRFMVSFLSHHKTINGVCSQRQRRFFLADNAEQARAETLKELSRWDGVNHWFGEVSVCAVPTAAPITLGYCRFGVDLRTT